ncbi:P-loop NTPase fold protein, partial [Myxococcus vastator]|uniref:P-loop NTPase fold protein n=1 Tax=Myxococcus vastator TaxID=2709664 RepID=UPI0019679BA5
MPTNDDTQVALVKILKLKTESQPGRVILLSGPWGSGKTYFWKHAVVPALQRKTLYVSAFGAESPAQLKTRLVTQFAIQSAQDATKLFPLTEKPRKLLCRFSTSTRRKSTSAASTLTDTLLNLVSSKFSLDPLELSELADKSTIICIDDIERTSSKFKIEELLGIANILSEHKGFDVVLVCNEDHLTGPTKDTTNAYLQYKEKTISTQHEIHPDLPRVFDGLLSAYDKTIQDVLQHHKGIILDTLTNAKSNNIRTLRRIQEYIAIIQALGISVISEAHISLLTALTVDATEGQPRDAAFYRFDEFEVGISRGILGEEKQRTPEENARTDFLERFGLARKYSFAESLYLLVRFGTTDANLLKQDLNPPAPTPSATETLLSEVRHEAWTRYSDQQTQDLARRLCDAAANNHAINAEQTISLLFYAKTFSEILGTALDGGHLTKAQERLIHLANQGDASISEHFEMTHGEGARRVSQELEEYRSGLQRHVAVETMAQLRALLRDKNYDKLASELRKDWEKCKVF